MAETADTATDPKTIPPAVFKNGREVIIKLYYSRLESTACNILSLFFYFCVLRFQICKYDAMSSFI